MGEARLAARRAAWSRLERWPSYRATRPTPRWRHEPGAPFAFDETYRVAQLPLVAPAHPRVLAAVPGQSYRSGRSEAPHHSLKNHGRIYFPAYPALVGADDAFALAQDAVGRPRTAFYALGYYNLRDELTPDEARDFAAFLDAWRDASVLEASADALVILATHDDLALEARAVWRAPAAAP